MGPATADKLVEAGFESYQSIAVASPAELSNTADIGDSTASDIINAARKTADIGGFETGADVLERGGQSLGQDFAVHTGRWDAMP